MEKYILKMHTLLHVGKVISFN